MKVTGIITEYNPFHNGHKYHLDTARSQTDADYVIVVMSGNYTQRGVPALIDKYLRAQMALENGADLVLELPLPYATGSAEYFAMGAVTLLDKLNVTDSICFGSECGDISKLQQIASLLYPESPAYTCLLQENLKSGLPFPLARSGALLALCPDVPNIAEIITSPNNILGIEYLKALLKRKSTILPFTIKRLGAGYHDGILDGERSSAFAIRTSLSEHGSLEAIRKQVPENVLSLLNADWQKSYPIVANDFSLLLQYKLLSTNKNNLASYLDLNKDLSDKIKKNLKDYTSFDNFCDLLKSKDVTHTRISRSLLHILLDITAKDMELYKSIDYIPYARILGFKKDATPLLNAIKKESSIPMISKLADAQKLLDHKSISMLEKEITASHIYEAVVAGKFGQKMKNEYTRQIVIR